MPPVPRLSRLLQSTDAKEGEAAKDLDEVQRERARRKEEKAAAKVAKAAKQKQQQQQQQQQQQGKGKNQQQGKGAVSNELITPRALDYSKWYLDVVYGGELVDQSPVRGCELTREGSVLRANRGHSLLFFACILKQKGGGG